MGARTFAWGWAAAALVGCSGSKTTSSSVAGTGSISASGSASAMSGVASTTGGSSGSNASESSATSSGSATGGSPAARLANRLRGNSHFLVGMGNDLAANHDQDGAYTLGPTLDLHDAYLVGLPTKGGWPDWNPGGSFVNVLSDAATAHGVTPMYTLYMMAANGDGNLSVVTDDTFMGLYFQGAKLLFQRIAMIKGPAVVHIEPDFWGYAIQKSKDGTGPVHIAAHAPDCAGVTEDFAGLGECFVKLRNKYAPNAAIGLHFSTWGADVPTSISFFKAVHAQETDFIATDMLDRDAGCFEAHTDPNCQRTGTFYWDETNQTHPNFHDHLSVVQQMTSAVGLPMLWWQVPFGVPSTTPGGTAGHYRDNRVHYIFSHLDEFIAARGAGVVFGTGAGNQTYITTDGGQFKTAVARYFASPPSLP